MKKRRLYVLSVVAKAIVILAILMATTIFIHSIIGNKRINATYPLDKGWQIQINDTLYENVTMRDFYFPVTQKGDVIILTNRVPEKRMRNILLQLWICHATVEVKIDNEVCYSYGRILANRGDLTGAGYHWIPLPAGCQGKEFTITYCFTENDAVSKFEPFVFGESTDLIFSFIQNKFYTIIIGNFLMVASVIGFLFISVLYRRNGLLNRLIHIFTFAFCMGAWTLCNNGIIQMVSNNLVMAQKMEYIVLYFAPIPLLLLCYEINRREKIAKSIVIIWLIIYFVFNVGVNFCQIRNYWHYPVFLPVFHAMMIISVLFVIGILIYDMFIGKREVLYIVIGGIIQTVCTVFDLSTYLLDKFWPQFHIPYLKITSMIGSLIFVIYMFLSYVIYVSRNIESQTKMELLKNIAYRDILTGIYNRTKIEMEFDELGKNNSHYYVIFFDLNGLKQVNDSQGHEMGDQLIKGFADILNVVFSEKGVVGRMGGDEFIVILEGATKQEVQHLIENMLSAIKRANRQTKKIKFDASYGVASSNELHTFEWETICSTADERMYAMKKRTKKERE